MHLYIYKTHTSADRLTPDSNTVLGWSLVGSSHLMPNILTKLILHKCRYVVEDSPLGEYNKILDHDTLLEILKDLNDNVLIMDDGKVIYNNCILYEKDLELEPIELFKERIKHRLYRLLCLAERFVLNYSKTNMHSLIIW